jgi:PKD repeat protein
MGASMGAAITAIHSTDGSGNDNWTFWYVPVAAFLGTPLTGAPPLLVTFTDTTANTPTSWAWDFGDLETSILQSPIHTYLAAGTYTVALKATNLAGDNTETKIGYITVVSPSGNLMIGSPGYYEDVLRFDDLVCGESMAKLY